MILSQFIIDIENRLLLFLVSLVFFVPILVEYARTGLVPRIPTLITCGFIVIAAIQAFFSGMILETIEQKNKQNFELELIRTQSAMKDFDKE